jgi:PBS lyase HEAT-like repeat
MTESNYPPPLDRLLTHGDPGFQQRAEWPDYVAMFNLGAQHIPDLIRMATDADLNEADTDSSEVWAPLHAWRALGQLRAEAAVEPLLTLLTTGDEDRLDDSILEELPDVYGMIGPAAIPALSALLADDSQGIYGRMSALTGLGKIAEQYPGVREAALAPIVHQLEAYATNDEDLNGFLISELMRLKAAETLPLMEQAFKAGQVDPTLATWDDVQIEFGLKTPEEVGRDPERPQADPLRVQRMQEMLGSTPAPSIKPFRPTRTAATGASGASSGDKARAKRKMGKESRKKNKKRK